MSERMCANCKFWLMNPAQPEQRTPVMGQCRCLPPQIAVVMSAPPPMTESEKKIIALSGGRAGNPAPQPVFLTMWPSTKPEQGCGKWEAGEENTLAPEPPAG
jgi:hypothetical protein